MTLAACPRLDNDGDGWTVVAGDCNDDASISPAAAEVRGDGVDNDCKGITDPPVLTWAPDVDGDGYGSADADAQVEDCTAPEGYVDDTGDCDSSEDLDGDG